MVQSGRKRHNGPYQIEPGSTLNALVETLSFDGNSNRITHPLTAAQLRNYVVLLNRTRQSSDTMLA